MKSLFLIVLVVITTFNPLAQTVPNLIIKDVNVLTLTDSSVLEHTSVGILDNKIVAIGAFKKIKRNKATKIIDGRGQYLMPSLADMHVHLYQNTQLDTLVKYNLAAGVTRLRIMNSQLDQLKVKKYIDSLPSTTKPTLYLSKVLRRDVVNYSVNKFDSLMAEIKSNGLSFIKLFSLSSDSIFYNLMASANKNKVIVCGHYPHEVPLDVVLKSGFKSIEHLDGYYDLADSSMLPHMIQLTKENNVYNCPTLDYDVMNNDLQYPDAYKQRLTFANAPVGYKEKWEEMYQKRTKKAKLTIRNRDAFLPTYNKKTAILRNLANAKCMLLMGSDPDYLYQLPGYNMHDEMKDWADAGISNFTILKAATSNAAAFFNEETQWGTIEVGKIADMILLAQNPLKDIKAISTIKATIVNGKCLFQNPYLKK